MLLFYIGIAKIVAVVLLVRLAKKNAPTCLFAIYNFTLAIYRGRDFKKQAQAVSA